MVRQIHSSGGQERGKFVDSLIQQYGGEKIKGDSKPIRDVLVEALEVSNDNPTAFKIVNHLFEECREIRAAPNRVEGDLGDDIRMVVTHGNVAVEGCPGLVAQTRESTGGWENQQVVPGDPILCIVAGNDGELYTVHLEFPGKKPEDNPVLMQKHQSLMDRFRSDGEYPPDFSDN